MKTWRIVPALLGLSGLTHLWGLQAGSSITTVTKPLTMLLVMALLIGASGGRKRYRALVLTGLAFSLGGDIFLMGTEEWFVWGLVSFLIAHVFYIAAFSLGLSWQGRDLLWAVPFAGYGVGFFAVTQSGMGAHFVPALGYVAVISAMGWRACVRCVGRRADPSALAALAGAVLFILSDSLLCWDKFRSSLWWRDLGVMSSYFIAQALIAMSVVLDAKGAAMPTTEAQEAIEGTPLSQPDSP